jgi:hypothetical protein
MKTLQSKLLDLRLPTGRWHRVKMRGKSRTLDTLVKIGPRGSVKVADVREKEFDKLVKMRVNMLYGNDLRVCAPQYILKSDIEPTTYGIEL